MPNTPDRLKVIAVLKAMLIAADARDKRKDERIERLEKLVAAFKQAVFGRKSEKRQTVLVSPGGQGIPLSHPIFRSFLKYAQQELRGATTVT